MDRTEIGNTAPQETRDSREVERLARGVDAVTVRRNGYYDLLRASQPRPGDRLDGGVVQRSVLRRGAGGTGRLEYTVHVGGGASGYSGGGGRLSAVLEIEMAQTERPILSRSDFNGYADVVELWRESPPELRSALKYRYVDNGGNEHVEELQGGARTAASLMLRGVEAYLVFHPVVTLTTTHADRPADYASGIGTRCPPAESGYPGGYDWLKTADRLTRASDGTWTRVQQWTGASESDGGWDRDLYD